jgi:hypothetical protein|tara:strand:+ start:909 stop:1445 length:537 start_codon:yes stop_codon:yes gene_type:complete
MNTVNNNKLEQPSTEVEAVEVLNNYVHAEELAPDNGDTSTELTVTKQAKQPTQEQITAYLESRSGGAQKNLEKLFRARMGKSCRRINSCTMNGETYMSVLMQVNKLAKKKKDRNLEFLFRIDGEYLTMTSKDYEHMARVLEEKLYNIPYPQTVNEDKIEETDEDTDTSARDVLITEGE